MRPIIGVTMYNGANMLTPDIQVATQHLPQPYIDAVRDAGGIPVLLPALGSSYEARDAIDNVDGILLPAGPDLDPAMYGQVMQPGTGVPDRLRDEWETCVFAHAMSARVPVLGICRGMQLINVCMGGTLTQHLEHAELHGGVGYITHPVLIEPGSLLGEIIPYEDEPVDVTTRHHQGIARLGRNLLAVASAEDGTIEAVELDVDDDSFVLGVQWHPERDKDQAVFKALVDAARAYKLATEGA